MGVNRFDSYGFTTKTCPHQPDKEVCSSSSTKNALDGCRGLNVIVIQRNKFRNCQRKSVLGELRYANSALGWCGTQCKKYMNGRSWISLKGPGDLLGQEALRAAVALWIFGKLDLSTINNTRPGRESHRPVPPPKKKI